MPRVRSWLSWAILCVSAVTMLAMSGARMWHDASFWQDEARLAYNLLSMSPVELLGPLDSGHQFPRLYLALIDQLRFAFGYETRVLRAWPFFFFVAGVLLWLRLMWTRHRARPSVLALGVALCLVPGSWFAYGAMLKPYSLDVFLALLPFLLTDDTLDRRWRRMDGAGRLALWALPCLVSLTYGIALLGRLFGYWLGTSRSQGLRLPARSSVVLCAAFVAALAGAWLIDLRHALGNDALVRFWASKSCVATSDPIQVAGLYGHWLVDWLVGHDPFGGKRPVPTGVAGVVVGFMIVGASVLLRDAWRGGSERHGASPLATSRISDRNASEAERAAAADRLAWGTRGVSALMTVGGLFATGLLFSYPMCANRLTLFAWFSLLFVALEGAAWLVEVSERGLGWKWLEWLPALIAALVLPSSTATVAALVTRDAPQNIRPLLPILERAPMRPILVGRCSGAQGLTLPEWLPREDILFADEMWRLGEPTWPAAGDFWLVHIRGACPTWLQRVRGAAEDFRLMSAPERDAAVFFVRMPEAAELSSVDSKPVSEAGAVEAGAGQPD